METNKFLKKACSTYTDTAYFQCINSYDVYRILNSDSLYTEYDNSCQNDPYFYQVCGSRYDKLIANNDTLCGYYICDSWAERFTVTSGYIQRWANACDGKYDCTNNQVRLN